MYKFKIVLVRHAAYTGGGENPGISSEGKEQAILLGKKIRSEVGNEDVVIWTSSANRAHETAEIIKTQLQFVKDVEVKPTLWSDNKHRHDFTWLKSELNNFQGEGTLIIVSHLEYVQDFPHLLNFSGNDSGYAAGVVIIDGKCKPIHYY